MNLILICSISIIKSFDNNYFNQSYFKILDLSMGMNITDHLIIGHYKILLCIYKDFLDAINDVKSE